ncbi:MAG: putative DNA binding domain-containing protein [Algoriphagus sp.]|uniref:RNA-binding domain-containing protein n=1 Tax=Algoriphagus sp. TaxID=1872435 RepID=UPI0026370B34|nr:RNA-binding domain-containing protein [Algoriphagus sp.]MDG1279616.1 putative DNA binding domain-containing protein [Algoriphagus sp.]
MKSQAEIQTILNQLRSQGIENEVVEFKEAKNQYDFNKIGKYFSALCNEANLKNKRSAWLVFGIKDKDKSIVGSQFRTSRADLDSLKAEVANHTTGRLTFKEIYEVAAPEGRVVLFEIPAAPKGIPISWQGHYYGRDGEELNALNLEEVERIREQSRGEDWSSGIIEEASIQDLSPEAILKARESFKRKNSHLVEEIDQWNDETFLNKAKVCIKGKITRTAILLLGKSESEHFINPATAKISWILRDKDNIEKDYQHFTCPLLLNTEEVYKKIRNLKYRYISDGTLFPEEVDQYDAYIVREALNNCIAHQDYTLSGKINVVEHEDGKLVFINSGAFIPSSIEDVVITDAPEPTYRNPFLVEAMINLNMIDAIGSGIKRMFNIQRKKYFPMPDYEFTNDKVKLTITGKVVDINYARKIASVPDLSLVDIIALDKVAKSKKLSAAEIKDLKNKGLIEGRKPNFHISVTVAKVTGEKADYIKQRGIDDEYCQKIILDYLKKFREGKREDFEKVLLDKLPDVLSIDQKKNKVRNILQKMRREGLIVPEGKIWIMSKAEI